MKFFSFKKEKKEVLPEEERVETSKFTENIKEESEPATKENISSENLQDKETEVKISETSDEKKPETDSEKDMKIITEKQDEMISDATKQNEEDLKKEFQLFKIQKILHRIDHTLLKQNITYDDLKKLCQDAKHYGFYSVCVQPVHVAFVKRQLEGSNVKVCTVVSFPFGEDITPVKVFQARRAIRDGADEIDMVVSISALKRGDLRCVKRDISAVVKAAKKVPVKVIIETSLLTVKEMEQVCKSIKDAGALFVKTSTGYFGEGATVPVIKQLRTIVKENLSIKASGGIKTADDAVNLLNAGADRIGTSNGVAIAEGLKTKLFL